MTLNELRLVYNAYFENHMQPLKVNTHRVLPRHWHLFSIFISSVEHLPTDEVDAFYVPLSGLMDVHMQGIGKVRQPYSAFNKIHHHTNVVATKCHYYCPQISTIKCGEAFGLSGIHQASKCTR